MHENPRFGTGSCIPPNPACYSLSTPEAPTNGQLYATILSLLAFGFLPQRMLVGGSLQRVIEHELPRAAFQKDEGRVVLLVDLTVLIER